MAQAQPPHGLNAFAPLEKRQISGVQAAGDGRVAQDFHRVLRLGQDIVFGVPPSEFQFVTIGNFEGVIEAYGTVVQSHELLEHVAAEQVAVGVEGLESAEVALVPRDSELGRRRKTLAPLAGPLRAAPQVSPFRVVGGGSSYAVLLVV